MDLCLRRWAATLHKTEQAIKKEMFCCCDMVLQCYDIIPKDLEKDMAVPVQQCNLFLFRDVQLVGLYLL